MGSREDLVAVGVRPALSLLLGIFILVLGFGAPRPVAAQCPEDPPAGPGYYVAPWGDDGNPGTEAEPFATLSRARDAMRADPEIDTTYVRGGTYDLDSTLLLTSQDSGISFVAVQGETPVLSGAQADLGTLVKLDNADGVSLLGLTFRDAIQDTHLDGFALELRNADGAMIADNTFLHVGVAVMMFGSDNNSIVGNEMGHIGYVGVEMAGGNGNEIVGNHMHDLGEVFNFAAAGALLHSGADGNRIAYNLVENSARYGFSIKSSGTETQGNIIEYNRILNSNTETVDTGAIEMLGRSGNDTKTVIQYNYIEGSGQYSQNSFASGVYLDDLTSGVTIHGNFIKDISLSGFHLHGGRDISITNNVVILQNEPVLASSGSIWDNQLFVWLQLDGARPRLMENVEWTSNIISAPDGLTPDANYWKRSGGDLAGEPTVGDNLLHNVNGYSGPASGNPEDGSVFADPLFTDPNNGDYTLKASSPALNLGFEPLPFSQMGLDGFDITGASRPLRSSANSCPP